ncbi:MAG: protein kinase [Thermoanaerobaculia bacterium]|nr:protein kinase [Thermoanaerobaculia bacterium]
MIGRTIGHFEILDELGTGGMGVVYRARDLRLGREVAVKALPPEFADDDDRLMRFEREAQVLASLKHAGIGSIYDLVEVDSRQYLILELVEGPTLDHLIGGRGLELEHAVKLAVQIAEALAAAHRVGVVHRDLKPANIKVDSEGHAKVLDFGLAKVAHDDPASAESRAPTLAGAKTQPGVTLGTAAYMSPEQARGEPVDRRADIWAFGCVLYEMLAGRPCFDGHTGSDVRAAVLRDDPDWGAMPEGVPPTLRRLLAMCLEKKPRNRLRDMGDVRLILRSLSMEEDSVATAAQPDRRQWRWALAAAGLVAVGLAVGLGVWRSAQSERGESLHIPMAPPPGLKPSLGFGPSLAISADGRTVAYVLEKGTTTQLYVKGPTDLEARPVPGTRGARTPAFSPDGQWVAFIAEDENKLKKVGLRGGEPITLCDAESPYGVTWSSEDSIVFTSSYSGLLRVSADGGTPQRVTSQGNEHHQWPASLPGEEAVLFARVPAGWDFDNASIAVVPAAGGAPEVVLESAYYPRYAPTGHLVFVQGDTVLAAPFDARSQRVTGPAKVVLEGVWTSSWTGYADFAFSDSGTLVYVSGGPDPTRAMLVSVNRSGHPTPLLEQRQPYRVPRFSPDGGWLVFAIAARGVDLWSYDLGRRSLDRLTDSAGWDGYPVWQPGRQAIAFSSYREGLAALYRKDLLTEGLERLVTSEHANYPGSWSPDGNLLAYWQDHPQTGLDLWVYSSEAQSARPLLRTQHNEWQPEFSPDGRYIAYVSDETGDRFEVHVRPYPGMSPALKISTSGGLSPRWRGDGRELFYLVDDRVMVVELSGPDTLTAGPPRELFAGPYGRYFDVATDGRSFLMIQEMSPSDPPMRINLVTDWFEELGD